MLLQKLLMKSLFFGFTELPPSGLPPLYIQAARNDCFAFYARLNSRMNKDNKFKALNPFNAFLEH